MKDIKLEDVLPIDAQQYFKLFISTPDAKFNYLVAKGHGEVEVGPWAPCFSRPNNTFERVSRFTTNLSNNALVKKLTGSVSLKITETQRYFFTNTEELHVESTMEFGGSSLAENFSSEIEWVIHTLSFPPSSSSTSSSSSNTSSNSLLHTINFNPNQHYAEIKCNVKTEYKGYMFKGLIEKYVHQAACDSFHSWLKAVREKISLLQIQGYDQQVPSDVSSPPLDDEDEDDDDVFYDSVEISPSAFTNNYNSKSSSPSLNYPLSHSPPSLSSSRPAPPLTATLPTPSHFSLSPSNFINTTSPNHVIFATYNAGRPSRTTSPPNSTLNPSSGVSTSPSSSFTALQSFTPSAPRAWETAADSEKQELEEYRQKFALLVTQTCEREREVDARIARITQRMDAQSRRTRWFLVALAIFSLLWPSVARGIVKLIRWLGPILRQRMGR